MIFDKVCEILCDQLGVDEDNITMSSDIMEDLGADSLDVVTIIMSFEDEYGISISDEEAMAFKTVGDIVAYIENNL